MSTKFDMSSPSYIIVIFLALNQIFSSGAQVIGSYTSNAVVQLSSNFNADAALAIRDGNGEWNH